MMPLADPLARCLARGLDRDRLPLVLLFVTVFAMACLMPAQNDTWWQLRAGEDIWTSGRIVLVDQFTHTVRGEPWPDHEWLTQLLFFGIYTLGGLPLLTALCALAVTAAWGVVCALTPGRGLWRAVAIGVAAGLTAGSWSLRPQVLTMAMFAVTLWILVRRRWTWALPVLFLVWANLHGAVALGGVLMIAATTASLLARDGFHRTLLPVGALCLVATILTPLGWDLWLFMPASIQRVQGYQVQEWRTPGWDPLGAMFWLAGICVTLVILANRRYLRSAAVLTLALATMLLFVTAARSARNIPPFFLCAVPMVMTLLAKAREPRPASSQRNAILANAFLAAGAVVAALMVITHAWAGPSPRLQWTPVQPETIAAIAACDGPLYNRYDEGGYLVWFMKDRPVFIDSRQDPFPVALVLEQMRIERTGDYRDTFARYHIGCALAADGSPLARSLMRDGWNGRRAGTGWRVYTY
jgi:hypothetical protein